MELISWVATTLVLVSFFFDDWKLRVLNGLGAGLWLVWGIHMEEGAVIVLNFAVLCVHAYKLSIERGENSFATEIKKRLGKIFLKDRHGA